MLFKDVKIGFALTGSFCTFSKVFRVIEKLIAEGADVYPIISENVDKHITRFGTAEEWKQKLEGLTMKSVIKSIVDAEPIGPKGILDILIVAPCTGNTLAKIANSITDTSVTMAVKAHLRNQKPVIIAISTNDGLSANAKNLGLLLNRKDIYFVPFGQDDPEKKCNSLIADFDLIIPTINEVLMGRQIQPILVK